VTQQYIEPEYETPQAHRILKVVAWTLVGLGLLEWFVLGSNRPEDPLVSPNVGLSVPLTAPLVAGRLTR